MLRLIIQNFILPTLNRVGHHHSPTQTLFIYLKNIETYHLKPCKSIRNKYTSFETLVFQTGRSKIFHQLLLLHFTPWGQFLAEAQKVGKVERFP